MRIAIDAMGGDHAPDVIIAGALEAREVLGSEDELVLGAPKSYWICPDAGTDGIMWG